MSEHKLGVSADVYLAKAGVTRPKRWGAFVRRMHDRKDGLGNRMLKFVEQRAENHRDSDLADFYELKNCDLPLSLEVTSQFMGDQYRKYLAWFADQNFPAPQSLLDIGCDNGVLTCFYASLFPHARIVGVDRSQQGIERARELATKLRISNAAFLVGDIAGVVDMFATEQFEYIVATSVFREALDIQFPEIRYLSIADVDFPSLIASQQTVVNEVMTGLQPDGVLVSMERLPNIIEYGSWVEALSQAGLAILWDRAYGLSFLNHENEKETLCILVCQRTARSNPVVRNDVLGAFVRDELDSVELKYNAAEAVFANLNPKRLLGGVEATYKNGSGTHRLELREAGALALCYSHSNTGYRELTMRPKHYFVRLRGELRALVETISSDAVIREYE